MKTKAEVSEMIGQWLQIIGEWSVSYSPIKSEKTKSYCYLPPNLH
ncbi:hypothetical protein [uncultured Bacteroides sp.]